jgi:hypothetical protein
MSNKTERNHEKMAGALEQSEVWRKVNAFVEVMAFVGQIVLFVRGQRRTTQNQMIQEEQSMTGRTKNSAKDQCVKADAGEKTYLDANWGELTKAGSSLNSGLQL